MNKLIPGLMGLATLAGGVALSAAPVSAATNSQNTTPQTVAAPAGHAGNGVSDVKTSIPAGMHASGPGAAGGSTDGAVLTPIR